MSARTADYAPPRARVEARQRLLPPAGAPTSLAAHVERYGRLPALRGEGPALIAAVEASGLRGRGGAGFPTHRKLRAVAAGRQPVVVANGVEGEPASHKDALLMRVNPQLVLDGAVAAAAAVGARQIVIAVGRGAGGAHASMAAAIGERAHAGARERIELVEVPDRFVAGEETALVSWLNGGPAKPAFTPPRPFERGVGGRPTLVQNVETLAGIALIARYGAGSFREVGSADEPGSMLFTLGGAVGRPGITELAGGTPLREALERCDGFREPPGAVLVGGYFGTWVTVASALDAPLSDAGLRPLGASLGARSLAVLPRTRCGVAETARLAAYLAGESAGQCGPCVFGLAAIAEALAAIAACDPAAGDALKRLRRLAPQVTGRGACAHPNGATRLVESALTVFADEVGHHLAGVCTAPAGAPLLPIPPASSEWR
jgi:NADH:ubiquinone oxidoreductase subunit F (NADH-binding)